MAHSLKPHSHSPTRRRPVCLPYPSRESLGVGTASARVLPSPSRCSLPLPYHRAALLSVGQAATRPLSMPGQQDRLPPVSAGCPCVVTRPMGYGGSKAPRRRRDLRRGDTRGCSDRARVYHPFCRAGAGAVGVTLTGAGAGGSLRPLTATAGRRTHTGRWALGWTLVQAPAAPCRMCRKEIEPRGGP